MDTVAVGGRRGNTVAECVDDDQQELVGIDEGGRPKHPGAAPAEPGRHQDGVVACFVERAGGAVADPTVEQGRAAVELEVAELKELQLRALECHSGRPSVHCARAQAESNDQQGCLSHAVSRDRSRPRRAVRGFRNDRVSCLPK